MTFSKKIEFLLYQLISVFVRMVGFRRIRILAAPLGYFFYFVVPIRKKVVIKNLTHAFPTLDRNSINRIALNNYISISQTFLEILSLQHCSAELFDKVIQCTQIERIKELLTQKRGLILLTAHYGNWELGAIAYALKMKLPITVLAKKQKNIYVSNSLKRMRERFGNKEILLGTSIRELYSTLITNNIVGIVADQRAPQDSIKVKFFGIETPAFSGPAAIALKTKSPMIMILIQRNRDGSFTPRITEIPMDKLPERESEKIIYLTQRYFDILESAIRETPEQWFWMHNIWKSSI